MTISFIVPTLGRASLAATLRSIELQPGDEVLVVGAVDQSMFAAPYCGIPCASGQDWGATERTRGMREATGDYLAFLDDDDTYAPGHRALMASAIARTPGRPVLFRMTYPNSYVLWREPSLVCGNVSTQMILIPNDQTKLGAWTGRREGDYDFLSSMQWPASDIVWRPEIVAHLGHNDAH